MLPNNTLYLTMTKVGKVAGSRANVSNLLNFFQRFDPKLSVLRSRTMCSANQRLFVCFQRI